MKRAVVIAVLASLSCPALAAAEPLPLLPPLPRGSEVPGHPDSVRPAPVFRSGFAVEAGRGYRVGVSTFGGSVYLEVWRGSGGRRTSTAYLAHGVGRPERLQATFGRFGRVSMRFRESRNRTWFGKRRTCRGANRFIKRRGTFHGNLRFRGEGGYVSVRIHRAKGAVVTPAPKCLRRKKRGPGVDFLATQLPAGLLSIGREGTDSTTFIALAGRKDSLFGAVDEESRGRLAIVRFAVVHRPVPIHRNEALTALSVSPPAPFHGTGRYRAAPDGSNTWSGNLSVDFPGAPRFPLTGPEFETFLEVPFQ